MNAAVRRARLRGAKEAERMLRLLEVRERLSATGERVDVFGALAWLDVRVLFKPLEGLVGAFVPGDVPGVAISTRRPPSVQRFTAAHELGHAVLGHSPSLDSPGVLADAAAGRARPLMTGFASYLQEVEADAFAGAFLLPSWLITRHARRQNWGRVALAVDNVVYQLSLRCGASYQATAWALERNGFVGPARRDALLRVRPRDIKARLGHRGESVDMRSDAWLLGPADAGLDVEVVVGDTVSLRRPAEEWAIFGPPSATFLEPIDAAPLSREAVASDGDRRLFRVRDRGAGAIHVRPANLADEAMAVELLAVERETGLSSANRKRLIGDAAGRRLSRAA